MGNQPPLRATLFPTLIENKDASSVSHFYPIGELGAKGPDNAGSSFAITGQEEGPGNSQRLVRDLRKILGKIAATTKTTPKANQ